MEITSLQNNKVKFWVSLHEKKNRDKVGMFLIEGDHLINEAKKNNLIVETISIDDNTSDYLVTKEIMKKISKQESISNIMAVAKYPMEQDITGNVLILDNIQDPGNLGTIIRSSVAFGFKNIILGNDCVDAYNPKVIRSTEGMIFNTNIKRTNLVAEINKLRDDGYEIIGTDVCGGKDIRNVNIEGKFALIIGSEGRGIGDTVKELCDGFVYINMDSNCESLNAGVAASILMYEVYNG